MRLRAPINIVETSDRIAGWQSRAAGFTCQACGDVLPVWTSHKTMRPRSSVGAMRCSGCDNHLLPVLPFGVGAAGFALVTLPLFFLTLVSFAPTSRAVSWLTYEHPTRGDGEPNALAMTIAIALATILSSIVHAIVAGRLSHMKIENDWSQA